MGEPIASSPAGTEVSLKHLQAELLRIDVLIRRQIQRWRLAGQDPTDAFRGLYVSDDQADALLARPFGGNWGHMAPLIPEEDRAYAEAEAEAARQAQALVEEARGQDQTPRLTYLAEAFGLDRFELDALLVCLAPALDLRYERLYGYLQDDVTRKRPGVNLILDLLCGPGVERLLWLSRLADDAPLFQHRLLERVAEPGSDKSPLLSQSLRVDGTIVAWLLGRYQPHADLGSHASLAWPGENEVDALLTGADRCNALFRSIPGSEEKGIQGVSPENAPPILVFYGPDRAGQEATARLCAARMSRPLLAVDLAGSVALGLPALDVLHLALRDARLAGALPYIYGWDACLATEGDGAPPPDLLAELCTYPDLAIVAGQAAWQATGIERNTPLFWLEFPVPAYPQRRALWEHFLQTGNPANQQTDKPTDQPIDVTGLAGQFALTSGQIRDAVASAWDMAMQRGSPLQMEDLFLAARAHSNPRLSSLARKIVPRYVWEDIILPADQLALLREIVATVRGRPLVLDEWGVGRKLASSAGVPILFAGPPGTGKTMAAEIIAAELGLDLYKIDLSTVVSKYIGETEKNLERIFNEAQSSNAILFFDEADAIFGKRSEVRDAHDRYANIEISYLLQRMEMYDGVTILATNLRANLDEAFTRRLQFAVDFPFPEEEYRLRIWQTLFPPDVPREADLDFGLLARRFKLAGGNIRNIIVSAAYLAAADGELVTMEHLLHGTRRELQKMGRLVNERDMAV
jgi:AAA+ superfamily predicted ATPase